MTTTIKNSNVIYNSGSLNIEVDKTPIGGFRGKIGALSVTHESGMIFTEWSHFTLLTLSHLIQKILKINEEAGIQNTLIYARQDCYNQFKLSLIPYPKCNWIEKIQGAVHAIFGSPVLKQKQIEEIESFYNEKLTQDYLFDSRPTQNKNDAFCRAEVIERQKIAQIINDDPAGRRTYDLLFDNRPKGATKSDPHLLVVPSGSFGHVDGSNVSSTQRYCMLNIVQTAMRIFLQEKHSTVLYLERNGSKLQGVQHKHSHAIGIKNFPKTFCQKLWCLFRLVWPSALSMENLKSRIRHYQAYTWVL